MVLLIIMKKKEDPLKVYNVWLSENKDKCNKSSLVRRPRVAANGNKLNIQYKSSVFPFESFC